MQRISLRNSTLATRLLASAAAVMVMATGIAHAQESAEGQAADDGYVDDGRAIVITARKRSEVAIAVPVSVSTLAPTEITRYNADDLVKIGSLVPQLSIARAGSGNGGLTGIRGVSVTYTDAGVDSPVSSSIDGAQFSRNYLVTVGQFDLERVEVLKGPQALFFGKNSVAGVISLTSAGPTREFKGMIKGGYEFVGDEAYVEGFVSGPLSDTLGARLAVRYSDMQGYFVNRASSIANPFPDTAPGLGTYPGTIDSRREPNARTIAGRLTLAYDPSDDFTATLKVFGSSYRDTNPLSYAQIVYCRTGNVMTGGVIDPFNDCVPDKYTSFGDLPLAGAVGETARNGGKLQTSSDAALVTLDMTKSFGDVFDLSSVTTYFKLDQESIGCFDLTVYCRNSQVNGERNEIFSQEFRGLSSFDSPINFMAGVYYEKGTREYPGDANINSGGAQVLGQDGTVRAWTVLSRVEGETISPFGQLIWDVTPTVQITGGVRYTHEVKQGYVVNTYVNQNLAFGNPLSPAYLRPAGSYLNLRYEDDNWSPEATITWRITPAQTIYGAYRTGYKSGGFSNPGILQNSKTPATMLFGSEDAEGIEVGYKAELFDRRVNFAVTGYRFDFGGLQRGSLDTPTLTFIVRNAAKARTEGVELDLSAYPTPELALRTSIAYNDAKYLSFPGAPCYAATQTGCTLSGGVRTVDLSGTTLARAPKFVATAGFAYDTSIGSGLMFGITGDMKHSSSYLGQDDYNPFSRQRAYQKFNASVKLYSDDERWEFALMGRNLTNEYVVLYTQNATGGPGADQLFGGVDRPREITIQGTFRF